MDFVKSSYAAENMRAQRNSEYAKITLRNSALVLFEINRRYLLCVSAVKLLREAQDWSC